MPPFRCVHLARRRLHGARLSHVACTARCFGVGPRSAVVFGVIWQASRAHQSNKQTNKQTNKRTDANKQGLGPSPRSSNSHLPWSLAPARFTCRDSARHRSPETLETSAGFQSFRKLPKLPPEPFQPFNAVRGFPSRDRSSPPVRRPRAARRVSATTARPCRRRLRRSSRGAATLRVGDVARCGARRPVLRTAFGFRICEPQSAICSGQGGASGISGIQAK